MIDLHSHILPGIDDGAKDEDEAVKLLQIACESGISKIAFTSHFNCEEMDLERFLKRRQMSCRRLKNALQAQEDLKGKLWFKLGAEVKYSPNLVHLDLQKLCISGTGYLLLELPFEEHPYHFDETVYWMQLQGIQPVIAHIERYSYMMKHMETVLEWVENGLYIQANASSLLRKDALSRQLLQMIRANLIQVLARDTHSVLKRPPLLTEGMQLVRKKLGGQTAERLEKNAACIFAGRFLEKEEAYCPQKRLGRWRT